MIRIITLVFLMFAIKIALQSQTPVETNRPIPSKSTYEIISVPVSQTFIEEQSLVFQAEVVGAHQSLVLPGNKPKGVDSGMTEMTTETPNAFRCYGFFLASGERLKIKLKGKTEGKIGMRFLPKTPPDGMISQVRRANMAPAPTRTSKIEITNILDRPYQVALMLYGQANYPYILEIERIK